MPRAALIAALALVLAPTPFTVWVVATAWRRYTGRADSVTLTLTRAGGHYLADRP